MKGGMIKITSLVIFIMGNCILKPVIAIRAVLARGCRHGFKGENVEKTLLEAEPTEDVLMDLGDLFKIFGDTTRIKILFALFKNEESVGEIARNLAMTDSAVSHQLKVLKDNELIKFRREGKSIFYSLADDHVISILSQGLEHILE
jgi:ArsR family transcriptional regulator